MANWCRNEIVFTGKKKAINLIVQLFKNMAELQKKDKRKRGQLPDFITGIHRGYFFDINWEDDNCELSYQTKWSPNIEVLQQIAEHYHVNFTLEYEELGCWLFGRATYINTSLSNIYLDNKDFEAYQFNEETDNFHFEGKTYESDYPILETLLERKITKQILKTFKN